MLQIRASRQRGLAQHGWLESRHTFSFADYYDSRFMGFGPLRVINEDRVQPGKGFGTHGHRDMEILSYVLEGALAHEDDIGEGSIIRPGDVQRMSAGTGVLHSEFNASQEALVHFLQIWIIPDTQSLPPSYEQKSFTAEEKRGRLRLVGSRDGRDGSVTIHQDVDLYASMPAQGETLTHTLRQGRRAWLQVARGAATVNGERLDTGDGVAVADEHEIALAGAADGTEVLLFDLP